MNDHDDELLDGPSDDPIPKPLHSAYSGAPFERCIECGADLLAGDRLYAIQKSFKDGEAILEMAICLSCGESESDTWSTESKARVDAYLREHPPRMLGFDLCGLCSGRVDREEDEVSSYALALGNRLIREPLSVCTACSEAIDALLSAETRRALDEFNRKNFPGVPSGIDRPISIFF